MTSSTAAAKPHLTLTRTDNPVNNSATESARPSIGTQTQERLGQVLRGYYGSVLSEPVPERLAQLLEQLRQGGTVRRKNAIDR